MTKDQIVHFLEWMNKVNADDPMRLETDYYDIAEMYVRDCGEELSVGCLTHEEESELQILRLRQADRNRWLSQKEFSRILELSDKKYVNAGSPYDSKQQQQGINGSNIIDLRMFLLKYPDQEHVKAACLHYLGDSVTLKEQQQQPEYSPISDEDFATEVIAGFAIRCPEYVHSKLEPIMRKWFIDGALWMKGRLNQQQAVIKNTEQNEF